MKNKPNLKLNLIKVAYLNKLGLLNLNLVIFTFTECKKEKRISHYLYILIVTVCFLLYFFDVLVFIC